MLVLYRYCLSVEYSLSIYICILCLLNIHYQLYICLFSLKCAFIDYFLVLIWIECYCFLPDDDTPNTTLDPPDTPTDATPEGDFPIFTNSPHDEVVLAEDYVVKDNAKQEKLNKKARERKKKQEKEEQKERDRDFDIGYRRQKKSVADMFNVTGRFSRRRNSSMDEIPYPEEGELAGPSAAKHGDSAVLY